MISHSVIIHTHTHTCSCIAWPAQLYRSNWFKSIVHNLLCTLATIYCYIKIVNSLVPRPFIKNISPTNGLGTRLDSEENTATDLVTCKCKLPSRLFSDMPPNFGWCCTSYCFLCSPNIFGVILWSSAKRKDV